MLKVNAEKSGYVTVLHFHGRIVNGLATAALREAVFAQTDAHSVVLDFAQVDLIDAGGLSALLELRKWTHSKGIEFRLMNITRFVQQVLQITRLDSVFEISTHEGALSAVAGVRPSTIGQKPPVVCFE